MDRGCDSGGGKSRADDVYEIVKQCFTPQEIVNLTLAIATINAWNRLSVAFRAVPRSYQSNAERLKAGV